VSQSARPQGVLSANYGKLAAKCIGILSRYLTVVVIVPMIAVQVGEAAALPPQSAAPRQVETAAAAPPPAASSGIPDSPAPQDPANTQAMDQAQSAQPQAGAPAGIGTAAAPVESPVGVAASKPAGAAIAPAKQRRTRTFAIRIAILAGVAVAVGTVVALSNASPNRP
jgi:hypothetical protein